MPAPPAAPRGGSVQPLGALLLQPDQRTHRVDGGAFDVGLAEDVVEDLERHRPGVAGPDHVTHELGELELALAGEDAVVPAPGEHVHGELGRVGHLHEEDLVRVDVFDGGGVPVPGQDVEGVQAGAEVGVVHHFHEAVGVLVVVDVLAPGEGLVGDLDAVLAGEVREGGELRGAEVVVVDGGGGDVGADQDGVHAQPGHEPELGLGPAEVGCQQVLGHAVEVAERLVEVQREAQVRGHLADVFGAER